MEEARAVLTRQTARQLLEDRRTQGFDVTGLAAIFDSVPHFRGHTQEIVSLTRLQLGDAYRFAWAPTTPEQGAPSCRSAGEAGAMIRSLCETCAWMREVVTPKGSRFLLCQLSKTDPAYPKCPPQPVVRCDGYRKQE